MIRNCVALMPLFFGVISTSGRGAQALSPPNHVHKIPATDTKTVTGSENGNRRAFLGSIAALTVATITAGPHMARADQECEFQHDVKTQWLQDPAKRDRNMTLLEDFSFVDAQGRTWTAPKGYSIDGATIPGWAWPIFGTPYVGDYRRASVVHDYYCTKEGRKGTSSDEVHRMFRDACRCDGVKPLKAEIMYTGVRIGGGRWDEK